MLLQERLHDLAEEACPALESSSARRLVPVSGGSAQTISHSSLVALPSVPGPHANLGAGGGDGEGGEAMQILKPPFWPELPDVQLRADTSTPCPSNHEP